MRIMKLQLVLSAHLFVVAATFQAHRGFVRPSSTTLRARGEEPIVKNYNFLVPKRSSYSGRFPSMPPLPSVKPAAPPAVVSTPSPAPAPAIIVPEPPAAPIAAPAVPVPEVVVPPKAEVIHQAVQQPPSSPPISVPELAAPARPALELHSTDTAATAASSTSHNPYLERIQDNHRDFVKFLDDADVQFPTKGWPGLQQDLQHFGAGTTKALQQSLDAIPANQFRTSIQEATNLLQTQGLSQQSARQIWNALYTKELGSWYIGILGFIVLSVAATAASSSSEGQAAAAATLVKDVVEETPPVPVTVVESSQTTMEQQVLMLTQATAAVAKELKDLKLTLAERDYKIATMQSDFRILQNELSTVKTVERQLETKLTVVEKELQEKVTELDKERALRLKLEAELKNVPKKSAPRPTAAKLSTGSPAHAPAPKAEHAPEKAISAKETTDKVKSAPSKTESLFEKATAPKVASEPQVAPSPTTASTKATIDAPKAEPSAKEPRPASKTTPDKAPAPKGASEPVVPSPTPAPATAMVAPAATESAPASKSSPEKSPAPKVAISAPKKAAKSFEAPVPVNAPVTALKAESKKASSKKPTTAPVAEPEPFFAAVTPNASKTNNAKTGSETKAQAVSNDDWSRLSTSTLTRKTVAELTDYLIARGMSVQDAKGKTLKKAALVQAVLSA